MRKSLVYFLVALMATSFYACSEDSLNSESVIKTDQSKKNNFDNWLLKNYTATYNIDFKYRMEDIESDRNYYLVPADYKQSIRMAKLVKHLCLEAYDEVAGPNFMKMYFPKMIHLIGSAAYNTNGTRVLGTAESGLKITLYEINNLDPTDIVTLNTNYFHVIHHEFTHILHQTIPYSTDFKTISGPKYINDSWNSLKDSTALKLGFITPYSSKENNEDFAELLSSYVTQTDAQWQAMLVKAAKPLYGTEIPLGATPGVTVVPKGSDLIKAKFVIVYNYMLNTWGIDLNQLRAVILRRSVEIQTLDLDTLN